MNNHSTVAMHIAITRRDYLDKQAISVLPHLQTAAKTAPLWGKKLWGGIKSLKPSGAAVGTAGLLGAAGFTTVAGAAADTAKESLGWAVPAIIAAPPLAALTAAALVSTATSPPPIETQTAQGEIEGAELDEALAGLRRRKAHRLRNTGQGNAERSLYIG